MAAAVASMLTASAVCANEGGASQGSTVDDEPRQAGTTLQTIEAIGHTRYRTGEVIDEEASASRSHVSRSELASSPRALADVLARETGVQFRQSGGFGSFASVSIRAASGAQTGVYLDGILLNNGANAVVDLSTLEMLNLDSVDIYKGSAPLQLGHGSIGGAVNLQTLRATSTPATRVRLGIGSFSQKAMTLSHQAARGKWDVVGVLSHKQSDNDFHFTNDNGTPLNPSDDRREKRANGDASLLAALLRAGYQQNADARVDLTVQASTRDLGVPEWLNRQDNDASYDSSGSQWQLTQILDNLGNWNSRHSVYWHQDSARYQDRLGQVNVGAQDIKNDSNTLGAKTYWDYLADSATIGLSLELRKESLDSIDHLDPDAAFVAERTSSLGTAHYAWFNSTGRWAVTPAMRWLASQTHGSPENAGSTMQDDSSTSHLGLQLGTSYQANAQLTFTANAGSYYREPSFTELYGSVGLIGGNPDLEAEQGINVDAGVQYRSKGAVIGATAFASERDELIVTTFNARGIGQPANTGAARVIGLELSGEFLLSPQIELRSNLTWQSAKSRQQATGFTGKYLPGEARFAGYARLQYRRSRATGWYELDVETNRFYDRANLLPAADTRQHSIGIDWQSGQWQTTLGIQNLTNENVEDFNGFPKPGRSWSLSITRTL